MKIITQTLSQIKDNYKSLFFLLTFSLAFLSIFKFVNSFYEIPMSTMTRDVTTLAKVPFYYGILSQICILFWAMAGAVCFVFYKISNDKWMKDFFIASCCVTFILCIDDAFLLHEEVFPKIIGIPENLVYAIYLIIMGGYVLKFYKTILKTDFIFFLMAITFLALSMLIDKILSWKHLLEDGAKFIGIISWFTYFFKTGLASFRSQKN